MTARATRARSSRRGGRRARGRCDPPWRRDFGSRHPAGDYALDFFCPRHKLAIEVDGEPHNRANQPKRDAIRDAWVLEPGVRTLRIPAIDILRDLEAVVRHIIVNARGDYPSTGFAGSPPPPGEE